MSAAREALVGRPGDDCVALVRDDGGLCPIVGRRSEADVLANSLRTTEFRHQPEWSPAAQTAIASDPRSQGFGAWLLVIIERGRVHVTGLPN